MAPFPGSEGAGPAHAAPALKSGPDAAVHWLRPQGRGTKTSFSRTGRGPGGHGPLSRGINPITHCVQTRDPASGQSITPRSIVKLVNGDPDGNPGPLTPGLSLPGPTCQAAGAAAPQAAVLGGDGGGRLRGAVPPRVHSQRPACSAWRGDGSPAAPGPLPWTGW